MIRWRSTENTLKCTTIYQKNTYKAVCKTLLFLHFPAFNRRPGYGTMVELRDYGTTRYLRNNGIGGLLECWPPERRGAAVCEESVLHGLPRCIG